jgi:hypothetical protein
MPADQDWRLEIDLAVDSTGGALRRLIGIRPSKIANSLKDALPQDVVLTHERNLLFAYAASDTALIGVRHAIEGALRRENLNARICVCHWDGVAEIWHQTDPPIAEDERLEEAKTLETRTLVVDVGRLISPSFKRTMLDWTNAHGIECTVGEHPHLLTTQLAFTVTGPSRKLDRFSLELQTQCQSITRAEEAIRHNPM